MSPFDLAVERAVAELRDRLVADALALAAGGHSAGGIRRCWRAHARELALLRARRPPPGTQPKVPGGARAQVSG